MGQQTIHSLFVKTFYEILQWYRQYYPQDEKIIKEAKIWLLKKIDELIEGYAAAQKDEEIDAILKSSLYFSELNLLMREFPFRSWLLFLFQSGKNYKNYLKCRKIWNLLFAGIREKLTYFALSGNNPVITIKGNLPQIRNL